jgi:pyridinium-3,5-bisthiocarboxylic acid mononucleotide nickel chelatase
MKRVLYFDAFSGLSGNMILGALVDLGVNVSALTEALSGLELSGWSIGTQRVERRGLTGCHVTVEYETGSIHRTYVDIVKLIADSNLEVRVKNDALKTFEQLAQVESKIHGIPIEQVHFHEVGAVDSIIDIVGTAWCLRALSIDEVQFSSLPVSRGFVQCAHGEIPLPAPATMRLLEGVDLCAAPEQMEWVTPTGAALVTSLGRQNIDFPHGRLMGVGTGAGTKKVLSRANLLRACIFEVDTDWETTQAVCLIETNLDDATSEEISFLLEQLWQALPHDVWVTPMMMKKNRIGQMVSVLCDLEQRSALSETMFRHSSTFGVRFRTLSREILRRQVRQVVTPYGPVTVKDGYLGEIRIKSAPEYEDCARLAREHGVSIRMVFDAANGAGK